MGQRHPLRPVRARSRPCPLRTGPYVVFQQQSGRYPCHGARAVTHRNAMIRENTRISFHYYSDPVSGASNRVSLRGTMATAKTRGRTRDVLSQEDHFDRSRPALIIPLLLGALRIYPAAVPVPNENPSSNNFPRVSPCQLCHSASFTPPIFTLTPRCGLSPFEIPHLPN